MTSFMPLFCVCCWLQTCFCLLGFPRRKQPLRTFLRSAKKIITQFSCSYYWFWKGWVDIQGVFYQPAITCSEWTIETLEQSVKYVHYCELWTYFIPCTSVSIVDFEQVNAGWVIRKIKLSAAGLFKSMCDLFVTTRH